MQHSTGLLKGILASGLSAALAFGGMLPAAAHPHGGTTHAASPKQTHSAAPARVTHAAPVRQHAAPVRRYSAPAHVMRAAPVRHYSAPVRRYSAPAHVMHAAPLRRYSAPAHVMHAAPVRRYAPFVQRVAPQHGPRLRQTRNAPFVQYVRSAPRVQRRSTRTVAASPLVRSMYVARARSIPVVYHPRYIAGRVEAVRSNTVIIDPPTGAPVIVRDVVLGGSAPAIPAGTYVTMPVTYTNGYYTYAQPAYGDYTYGPQYGYSPQYQYAYAPAMYCNGNSSTALYAALLPAVIGMLSGNGNSLNTNDLTQVALTAALGGNGCQTYAPSTYYAPSGYSAPAPADYGYAAPVSYTVPVTYAVAQTAPVYAAPVNYATPYDSCLLGDEVGDDVCAPATSYAYGNYSMYGGYTPQQVQGVVIGRTGDMLMVLTANGTPTFVYAAPALQSGYAVNGPIRAGQIVDAYGYYSGNTFVATALV